MRPLEYNKSVNDAIRRELNMSPDAPPTPEPKPTHTHECPCCTCTDTMAKQPLEAA